MDDFEIYIRAQSYESKLYRTAEKFIARIKWLPYSKGFDILRESQIMIKNEREERFEENKIKER